MQAQGDSLQCDVTQSVVYYRFNGLIGTPTPNSIKDKASQKECSTEHMFKTNFEQQNNRQAHRNQLMTG